MTAFYALFLGGRHFNCRRGARPRTKKEGQANSNVNYEYTYDNLGRLNYYYLNLGSTPLLVNPVYYESERNTDGGNTYQTTQIKREEIGDRGYAYTYDKVGNIKTINKVVNGKATNDLIASYTYDALGQLETEINVDLGQKIIYTYDNGGNITSKSIYAYTNGTVGALQKTINYTYDSTWKDKLISYGDDSITYDNIGNPLTYRNGMTFTWNGRQMKSAYVVKTENNVTTTANVNYTYDADGLRTTKQVNSTLHEYEYVGSQLVYEKRGNLKFYYRYNAMGELASIKRVNSSGTEYTVYVVTNTRGDIEELRLASGTMVARYVYDTWGNTIGILDDEGDPITDTSSIAVQNPFRYRSYYYDNESGFYYLQSRYYDPVTCRFVNADSLVDSNSGIIGNNLYIYAANNPVNNYDPTGHGVLKNIIKGFVEKVAKPIVDTCKKIVNKLVKGTRTVGITGNVAFGGQYTFSRGIAFDGKGNIGYAKSNGPGGGSPNASIGIYETQTNAPDIKKLDGFSAQMGGSVDVCGASVGLEPTFFIDSESKDLYIGLTSSISWGVPIPAEIHADYTNTEIKSINIFEEFDNMYNAIMKW